MCVIVDANVAHLVFRTEPSPDYEPLIHWLFRQDGKLVLGGRNRQELEKVGMAFFAIRRLAVAGRTAVQPDDEVNEEERSVRKGGRCRSDDPHIIALARVSGARTLCSADQDLHTDFTDPELVDSPRGQVYQNATHRHLLRHTSGCPGRGR